MATSVIIDSCAWNFLYRFAVDLDDVLPPDRFALRETREVQIERSSIPDIAVDGTDKRPLKKYIAHWVDRRLISATANFGFATFEPDGTMSTVQVNGGFGQGTFESTKDRDWRNRSEVEQLLKGKSKRNTGLSKNQADASVAVRSFESIVLTYEKRDNRGPIQMAAGQGGTVIFLDELEHRGIALKEWMSG